MPRVLFLGGPRHQQHHDVPDRLPSGINVMPNPGPLDFDYATAYGPQAVTRDVVLYALQRQPNGAPVYVAPGWPPAPKACVMPDCDREARVEYFAAAYGRLAGREWSPGDRIDLCPPHGMDVFNAQFVRGVAQLAEWLRPDAQADAIDIAGIGSLGAEQYAASVARALRVKAAP